MCEGDLKNVIGPCENKTVEFLKTFTILMGGLSQVFEINIPTVCLTFLLLVFLKQRKCLVFVFTA